MGVELCKNDIIATTDAGCIPHPDWLEKITKPFLTHLGGDLRPPSEEYQFAVTRQESSSRLPRGGRKDFSGVDAGVGLVAGFYEMPARTPMQKAISIYLGVHPKRYDPETFIPSCRSAAFKKQLWERVGGFDEKLNKAGEDTQFFYNVVKTGARIVRVKEARVVWKELENITFKEAMGKFFNYAKGDVQAGIWWHPTQKLSSHNIKIVFIFTRYLASIILLVFSLFNPALLVLLVILATLYILWPVYKWKDVIADWRSRLWLSVIQIFSDFAVMSGFLKGIIGK